MEMLALQASAEECVVAQELLQGVEAKVERVCEAEQRFLELEMELDDAREDEEVQQNIQGHF